MTIQVGMVGTDGIVLASDTCMVELDFTYNTINGRKIFLLDAYKVVWGFAGDESAYRCGQQLEEDLDAHRFDFRNIGKSLERSGDDGFRRESERVSRFRPDINRRLLVIFYGDQVQELQLWEVKLQQKGTVANRITGKVVTGDRNNNARFFASYYQDSFSTERLLQLAAHIVLMAHERNTLLIEGLDLLVIGRSGCKWIEGQRKEIIQRRSLSLHELIKKELTQVPEI